MMTISGMHCGHCVDAVTKAVNRLEGVQVRDASVGSLRVTMMEVCASKSDVFEAIRAAGSYDVESFTVSS